MTITRSYYRHLQDGYIEIRRHAARTKTFKDQGEL